MVPEVPPPVVWVQTGEELGSPTLKRPTLSVAGLPEGAVQLTDNDPLVLTTEGLEERVKARWVFLTPSARTSRSPWAKNSVGALPERPRWIRRRRSGWNPRARLRCRFTPWSAQLSRSPRPEFGIGSGG